MNLIVITKEVINDRESELESINHLFSLGLSTLHLRKPFASAQETSQLIERIDQSYRNRIVLHDNFDLVEKYQLKGIHLNRRNQQAPSFLSRKSISKSCHSLECLEQNRHLDYLFLSPVFDSLSKKGYRSAFTPEKLSEAKEKGIISSRVIALGGIDETNIGKLKEYGFGGAAVLGAIWGSIEGCTDLKIAGERFLRLAEKCL